MNRNKLFLNSSLQKQRNFPAEPESSAATACIAHKSLRICERCRLSATELSVRRTRKRLDQEKNFWNFPFIDLFEKQLVESFRRPRTSNDLGRKCIGFRIEKYAALLNSWQAIQDRFNLFTKEHNSINPDTVLSAARQK